MSYYGKVSDVGNMIYSSSSSSLMFNAEYAEQSFDSHSDDVQKRVRKDDNHTGLE